MWVEVVVGEPVDSWSTPAEIQDNLQDGTLLCKYNSRLLNSLGSPPLLVTIILLMQAYQRNKTRLCQENQRQQNGFREGW